MRPFRPIPCLALLTLVLALAGADVAAQIVVPDPDQPNPFVRPAEDDDDGEDPVISRRLPLKAAPVPTTEIVQQIDESLEFCFSAPKLYAIDCISVQFESIAETLPERGDYAEARAVLETAARDLRRVVRQSASETLPRVRLARETETGGTERLTARPLRAVEETAAVTAEARAAEIIEEAATLLLRSSAEDPARAAHYTRIAQAVDSSKVLLRSS